MIRKELFENNINSQEEMNDITSKFRQAWFDCWDLDYKETKIISNVLGVEPATLKETREGRVNPVYDKRFDEERPYYTNISTPVVEFAQELKMHPMRIILKKRFLVTVRSGYSSRLIDSTIRTFKSLEPDERKPTVILAKLVHGIIDENSRVMFSIREVIDKIEEEAMENPKKKTVTKSIFKLKRQLSAFHRLLWGEKELLSDINLGVIPNLKLVEEAKRIIADASDDIARELEFLTYYNNNLDSILSLLDLGSIHRVEKNLMLLTGALVVMTIFLILLEVVGTFAH